MGGNSDTEQTTTAEPWGPSQNFLKAAMPYARDLFDRRGFAPKTFEQATGLSSLAGQSNATQAAQASTISQAMRDMTNGSVLDSANRSVNQLASGQTNDFTEQGYRGLRGEQNQGAVDTSMNGMQQQAVGGLSGMLQNGMGISLDQNSALQSGQSGLEAMQSGQPGMTFADISQQLQGAKDRALAGAIPAAAAQFTGSGLGNSSVAQEAVGRSAVDAIAPYEYSAAEQGLNRAQTAYENAQQRALSASGSLASLGDSLQGRQLQADTADAGYRMSAANALGQFGAGQQALEYSADTADRDRNMQAANAISGMGNDQDRLRLQASLAAPSTYGAQFMPQQMLGQAGAQQDARAQAQRDAYRNSYNAGANREQQNLNGYLNTMMGMGGMGGSQTQTQPGASGMQQVAGAGLGGLGAYGALAANPATAPFALAGGGLAGLLGLF